MWCSEARHVLSQAKRRDPSESLGAILIDHARLIARENLLLRVSREPIMNDLFAVINLQASRLLTAQAASAPQSMQGCSLFSDCQQQGCAPMKMHGQAARSIVSDEGQSEATLPSHARSGCEGSCPPAAASQSASAGLTSWHTGNALLPQAALLRGQSCPPTPRSSLPHAAGMQECRPHLQPIPENASQPSSRRFEEDLGEQRENIRTPSQASAEGALLGNAMDTPHPEGLPRSSTATSADRKPQDRPPLRPLQPTAFPADACGSCPAQTPLPKATVRLLPA